MQQVSEAWKQEQQKKIIEAESFVDLTLVVGDPTARPDASASDNGHDVISNTAQITDGSEKVPARYATLERNLWVLDGTFSVIPDGPNYGDNGYVGNALSNSEGVFTAIPTITISFSHVHNSVIPGITITWGDAYDGEFADTYRVSWYNGTSLTESHTIDGNTSVKSVFSHDIQDYTKIVIEILKWSKPFHRARISHILMGIERYYIKSDLIKYQHTIFVDPLSAELPKAEIIFQVKNLNGEYNPDNPQSVNKYFVERQTVIVRYGYKLGGEVEWISAGRFFLSEWDFPQNGITATLTARDALEYMSDPYKGPSSGTLMSIALSALRQAEIPEMADGSEPWVIDSSLAGITAASGADLSENTIAEVLQYVANASCCVFYQDRDGKIHIEPIAIGETDYRIDRFNSYENSEISLTKQLKAVNVNDGQAVLNVGSVGEIQNVRNPLITASRAPIVAKWVADYLMERRTLSGSFRSDPRLDALDRVTNQNQFSENVVLVTQIDYSYNGAFRGSYNGRPSL